MPKAIYLELILRLSRLEDNMRVLLLNSPTILPDFDFIARIPNLGISSIAGNIDDVCEVYTADLQAAKDWRSFLSRTLSRLCPDLVGISAMSFQFKDALEACELAREHGARTLVGGYHPTLMYEQIATSQGAEHIDFMIRGEGEATMRELVQALDGEKSLKGVKGLSFKQDGTFVHNPPRELLDLSSIELPNRDVRLIKRGFYAFNKSIDAVETSRGCTQGCKFCSIEEMYGRSFRRFDLERVLADVEDAVEHGAQSVVFSDDNITLDPPRMMDLCERIIDHDLTHIHFYTQASAKGIAWKPELAEKMAEAGFKFVFLGIENVLKRNLDFFNKGNILDDSARAVKYLRDNGIAVSGGLVLGTPEDTKEDLWTNYTLARRMHVDIPIFYISTPYPATKLREEMLAEGLITNVDDFSRYDGLTANVRTRHLTDDELQYETWKMFAKYYDVRWVAWSRVVRNYPLWALRTILRLYPRYVLRRLLYTLHLKTERDFFEEDVAVRVYSKGYF